MLGGGATKQYHAFWWWARLITLTCNADIDSSDANSNCCAASVDSALTDDARVIDGSMFDGSATCALTSRELARCVCLRRSACSCEAITSSCALFKLTARTGSAENRTGSSIGLAITLCARGDTRCTTAASSGVPGICVARRSGLCEEFLARRLSNCSLPRASAIGDVASSAALLSRGTESELWSAACSNCVCTASPAEGHQQTHKGPDSGIPGIKTTPRFQTYSYETMTTVNQKTSKQMRWRTNFGRRADLRISVRRLPRGRRAATPAPPMWRSNSRR